LRSMVVNLLVPLIVSNFVLAAILPVAAQISG
jgi:hypothetical protein